MPPIYLCLHCDNKVKGTGRFCVDCNTAEKRRDMDEANTKHFKEKLNMEYHCKFCKREKEKRLKKKIADEKFNQ